MSLDPSPAAPLIEADGLSKRYGRREAVTELHFAVQPGQISALLGPNGAGKTTTMRMLVGLSRPDAGVARVLGEPMHLGAAALSRVGVLIDGPAFVPHLTGMRNLRLLWTATGRAWPPPALDDALDLAGLADAIDRKVKSYSMGMKQRLMLAQAVMRNPVALILDEPANGLDPAEIRALRDRLTTMAQAGAAVLISSHQLAEVEQLATHTIVLNQGNLVTSGPISELQGHPGAYRIEVDDPQRAATVLRSLTGVTAVDAHDTSLTVTAPEVASRELVQALVVAGVGVSGVQQVRQSLEEAFLAITEGDHDHVAR